MLIGHFSILGLDQFLEICHDLMDDQDHFLFADKSGIIGIEESCSTALDLMLESSMGIRDFLSSVRFIYEWGALETSCLVYGSSTNGTRSGRF
jgi:hypothetical protein